MAEAPNATGQSADGAGAADAASGEPEPIKTFTQQQVEAIVAQRVRKLKQAESELRAQLAERDRKLSSATADDDDVDADPEPPKPAAGAAPAPADDGKKWRSKIQRIRDEHDAERKALQAQIEEAKEAHNRTLIEHTLMAELSKRGNVADIGDVMELTAKKFDFVDGQVVPKDDDATTVSEFFDKWLGAHKRFVIGPVAGDGAHTGRLPGNKPAKKPHEMAPFELQRAAAQELLGHLTKR
jgi:hypothetical protein